MKLGQQIATRRKDDLRLSVSEAARRAGVHRLTWTAWEKNQAEPADHNYAAIEDALSWARGSVEAIRKGGGPAEAPIAPTAAVVEAGLARILKVDHRELILMFREVEEQRGRSVGEQWLADALDIRERARRLNDTTKRDVS